MCGVNGVIGMCRTAEYKYGDVICLYIYVNHTSLLVLEGNIL